MSRDDTTLLGPTAIVLRHCLLTIVIDFLNVNMPRRRIG